MTKPTTHTFCKDKKGRRCTVAIRQAENTWDDGSTDGRPMFNVAVAVTSKKDNFSRKIGRSIVYGRLGKYNSTSFTDGVTAYLFREEVIELLTTNFDISEKRAILMLDKDLLHLPPPGTAFSRALEREAKYSFKKLEPGTVATSSIGNLFLIEEDKEDEILF